MCEATTLALIAAAGSYMQYDSAQDAHKERKSILDAASAENSQLSGEQAKLITGSAAETFNLDNRAKSYEEGAKIEETGLAKALLDANNGGEGQLAAASGNVSSDYDRAKASATANAASDIAKRAKLLSRATAGGLQSNREAIRTGDLATDVGGFSSKMNRNNRYAQNAVGGVFDGGSLAGGLLQGFGSTYRPTAKSAA